MIPVTSPASTSYFSAPSSILDPKLFDLDHLHDEIRTGVLRLLFNHLLSKFNDPHIWTKAWLAGSGVSYQWQAVRQPGDLDCLVGVDYVKFRATNTNYSGFSDQEIAKTINETFNEDLMPYTRNWKGYELTFYVNEQSDIRDINPYAAYDLILDDWTVRPDPTAHAPYNRIWEMQARRDHEQGLELLNRHNEALNEVRSATNPAHRVNAERRLKLAKEQAIAFYDDIHHSRNVAFSGVGQGYNDYNNFRWQAGKRSGVVQSLRAIKDQKKSDDQAQQLQTYGVELPTADTLVRRTLNVQN